MRHVPKKLTDCPENLRESIDWLIQVRYGNGEGDGLTQLSEALKKLIEEAISNATNSLNDRQSKLLCTGKDTDKPSDSSSSDPPVKPCCQEKDEEIKDAEKKMNGLKSSSTEESEKQIDEQNAKIKKAEASKNDCAKSHYLPEEERTKGLDEVKQQKKIVEKLKTFAESLTKTGEKNNILTHLCSGLETFLGFDPTSKGYTGSGIVYSDLDRLCDAVMGFLSGVLEAVKNENEVTTYDEYITSGNLNSVLKTLTTNIGTGRTGLADAVEQVREWLDGYGNKIDEKINEVKNPISSILVLIESNASRIAEETKLYDLTKLVNDWTDRAQWYISHVGTSERALESVDKRLQSMLSPNIRLMKQATETFKSNFLRSDLESINTFAGECMNNVIRFIEKWSKRYSQRLLTYLTKNIGKLYHKLDDLRRIQLAQLAAFVEKGLQQAFNKVNEGTEQLEQMYKGKVLAEVDKIKSASQAFSRKFGATRNVLELAIEQVYADIEKLADLSTFKQIFDENNLPIKVPVLEKIGEQNAFDQFTAYFTTLDGLIVEPVQEAMTTIAKGSTYFYPASLDDLEIPMSKIKGILEGTSSVPNIEEIKTQLQEYSVEINDVEDIAETLPKLEGKLKTAIEKICSKEKPENQETSSLLKALGEIPRSITKHLKELVVAVVEAIEKVVKDGVEKVMGIVHSKVKKIHEGIKNDKTDEHDYGLRGLMSQTAAGLKKIITDFNKDIDGALQGLQESVGKDGDVGGEKNVYTNLLKLKADVQSLSARVSDLQDNVAAVGKELNACIDVSGSFLKEADRITAGILHELRDVIIGNVAQAFQNIQTKTKDLYTKRKAQEVAALQKTIQQQFDEINSTIKTDKETHFKGFLATLNRFFTSHIYDYASQLSPSAADTLRKKALLPEEVTLKHFAGTSIHFFNDFLQNLYLQDDFQILRPRVEASRAALHCLLDSLVNSKNFDYTFIDKLNKLENALREFMPRRFDDPSTNLLAPLKSGLSNFTAQLGHAYVNRYSGKRLEGELLKDKQNDHKKQPAKPPVDPLENKELTPEGRNCAKVCLTIVEILGHDLREFFNNCKEGGGWRKDKINLHTELGKYFASCDYRVSKETKSQEGELNNSYALSGKFAIRGVHNFMKETENGYLDVLLKYLNAYYRVCHLSTFSSTRHPTSVHQMLVWLAGLPHTPTYDEFSLNAFSSLFEKKDKQVKEGKKPDDASTTVLVQDVSSEGDNPIIKIGDDDILDAYPHRIAAMNLSDTLAAVCTHAHSVLTAIQGHGHADGTYACDYNTNSYTLSYPNDNGACIDMLVDISSRLHEQLFFLLIQCQRGWKCNSWRECWYGQGIAGSSWTCNEKQCGNQNCPQIADQNANQNANQIARQTCDQHPNCGLKSPLQSFLEDGLQGFLPHRFDKVGCKAKCTVSNHRGLPCKTPMGFQDIGVAASHTQKGEHLMRALEELCGKPDSPLTKLCADLTCLLQQPPQSLGDMFAFLFCLINSWGMNAPLHKSKAFMDAVAKANFGDSSKTLDIAPMFENSKHEPLKESTHRKGDLYCLYSCDYVGNAQITCGRYMKPISLNTRIAFSSKNAGKYLSWIVYLTETFYSYLENLYNECCEKCNKKGTRCHDTRCVKDCHVNSYYEAQESATEPAKAAKQVPASTIQQHEKLCKTIARCPFSRPTLYKYGFVLNSLTNLSGADDMATKRTCGDLCKTLERVLNKKEKDEAPLATLIYRTIPNFLWEIRKPFSYLVLALWLLSLLYVIHIMVIRLDLLHIKSHLHSPSSHRIAAQSLLAAGRVNKLNKVFYLQP